MMQKGNLLLELKESRCVLRFAVKQFAAVAGMGQNIKLLFTTHLMEGLMEEKQTPVNVA